VTRRRRVRVRRKRPILKSRVTLNVRQRSGRGATSAGIWCCRWNLVICTRYSVTDDGDYRGKRPGSDDVW